MRRNIFLRFFVIVLPIKALGLVVSAQVKQKQADVPKIARKANKALLASAVNRVEAVYPAGALAAQIFGTVLVEVTIDENGSVTSARALSGHPLLREAALEAALGWTFQPTIIQGKPVKVVGTLSFSFNLPEYLMRGRAIDRLKQQVARSPKNARLHYQLGRAYEDNEQFVEALRSYRQAVTLQPDYGDALVAIGSLSMRLNHYDEALNAYNEVVLLNLATQSKAAAYRAIGMIHFRREEFREAIEPFKQVIALAPEDSIYFSLGLTYLKLGDQKSAMDQYLLLKDINSILAQQLLEQINEIK